MIEGWSVPDYRTIIWQGRLRPYCVVIPVVNEGRRLVDLLERIYSLGIPLIADVIIVDGGSSDGSLQKERLLGWKIRGLLIKSGPGGLSAQLKCAYAFALELGYSGIVTIDGNNKDDPAAIPDFIAALERGYDFVQASRFIPGGQEQNTPLIRHLAIRLIHAPLLSISSGFHWTDTTQGFRAYSREMLIDPRIGIFREVFSEYELLAYLSHRAPKLGYRCVELPSSRAYPHGKVPTKISSVAGNWKIFATLLRACSGFYDPRS